MNSNVIKVYAITSNNVSDAGESMALCYACAYLPKGFQVGGCYTIYGVQYVCFKVVDKVGYLQSCVDCTPVMNPLKSPYDGVKP